MNRLFVLALSLMALFASLPAPAGDYQLGTLQIANPWARPSPMNAENGAGYLMLKNGGDQADKLVSASADVAAATELHSTLMDGNVMKMRHVAAIDIPPNGEAELKPGGFHIMFLGLRKPLEQGQRFPVKLKFEKAGGITVEMTVAHEP